MVCQRAQIQVVDIETAGFAARALDLGEAKFRLDRTGDAACDWILELEDARKVAGEPVGPDLDAARRVDQLTGDPHPISAFANATLKHVADAKLAADLLHIDGSSFVGEARIPCDNEEPANAR